MSVTCQDLLPLKYFERIKLVAGQNGLDRTVTWPYVGQTSSVSQWVHGGELLFITGIAHSADKLKDLILECIQKNWPGSSSWLVMNISTLFRKSCCPRLMRRISRFLKCPGT